MYKDRTSSKTSLEKIAIMKAMLCVLLVLGCWRSLYQSRTMLPRQKPNFLHIIHWTLQAKIGRLDPLESFIGIGTRKRLSYGLNSNSYNVNSISIDASLIPLQGGQLDANKVSVWSKTGFQVLNPSAPTRQVWTMVSVMKGNVEDSSGMFSNIWLSSLV